jgi:hypothetical protein
MVVVIEEQAERLLACPDEKPRAALLVLSGSSGRLDVERAKVLASHGHATLAMTWFGGPRQPTTPREVALETFCQPWIS